MIMQRLRSVTKYFMWVVAASFILFIFFGFGSNILQRGEERKGNLIAEVNGDGVDYREFSYRLSKDINLISGSIGIDPLRERILSDQIINELIMEKILSGQINKRDIFISDKQVINIIKNSPPREILQDSTFWIGGQFDYNRYHELLRDPRLGEFINNYAERIKNDLPQRILGGEVTSLVRLTQTEIMENLMEDSIKLKLEYIRIPVHEWVEDEPLSSPEEFYYTHKELFRREGVVRLGYVSFPVEVDNIMIKEVRDLAKSIIERAENVSFDTLIGIYSYYLRERKLYYGWTSTEELPSFLTSALLGVKIDEITEPILSEEGFHIIKLIGRERGRLNLKEIFLPIFPSAEVYMNAMTEAWSLVKTLRSDTLIGIPDKYSERYITYGIGYIPDIGVDFGTFLDDPRKDKVSHPLAGEDSLYVFWVEDVDIGTPPFSTMKEEVEDTIKIIEASVRAKKYIYENLPDDMLIMYPEKGAWYRTPYFTLNNYTEKGIDLPDKIVNFAFNLREEMVSPPIRAGRDIYVLKVIGRKTPSSDEIAEIMPGYLGRMQMIKQTILYQGWIYDLRKNSDIKDWRSRLYE